MYSDLDIATQGPNVRDNRVAGEIHAFRNRPAPRLRFVALLCRVFPFANLKNIAGVGIILAELYL